MFKSGIKSMQSVGVEGTKEMFQFFGLLKCLCLCVLLFCTLLCGECRIVSK